MLKYTQYHTKTQLAAKCTTDTLHIFTDKNIIIIITRRALSRAHLPPTKVFRRLREWNHGSL